MLSRCRNNDSLSVFNSAEHNPAKIGKGRNPLVSTKKGEIPMGEIIEIKNCGL